MLYEKKKILIHRLVCFVLLIVCIGISVKYWKDWCFNFGSIWIYFFCLMDIAIPLFFVAALLLSSKIYFYNGYEIIVYSGWFHHYIKVNGEKMDEHNTIQNFLPIMLSCSPDDNTFIEATISLANRIALKINNKLYQNTTK